MSEMISMMERKQNDLVVVDMEFEVFWRPSNIVKASDIILLELLILELLARLANVGSAANQRRTACGCAANLSMSPLAVRIQSSQRSSIVESESKFDHPSTSFYI
jgi:hypothetical protein